VRNRALRPRIPARLSRQRSLRLVSRDSWPAGKWDRAFLPETRSEDRSRHRRGPCCRKEQPALRGRPLGKNGIRSLDSVAPSEPAAQAEWRGIWLSGETRLTWMLRHERFSGRSDRGDIATMSRRTAPHPTEGAPTFGLVEDGNSWKARHQAHNRVGEPPGNPSAGGWKVAQPSRPGPSPFRQTLGR